MSNLLRYIDYIDYSGASSVSSAFDVSRGIKHAEQTIARTRLGRKFYEALQDKIVDVSETYNADIIYDAGDTVLFNPVANEYAIEPDYPYVALQAIPVDTPPSDENIELGFWKVQSRFDDSKCGKKYNELWELYLAEYIAKSVMEGISITSTYKSSNNGIGRTQAENLIPASTDEIRAYKEEIRHELEGIYANMRAYMYEKRECFEHFISFTNKRPKKTIKSTRQIRRIEY